MTKLALSIVAIFGLGFGTGYLLRLKSDVNYSDTQISKYEEEIAALKSAILEKDQEIEANLLIKDKQITSALIAKEKANTAEIEAKNAEARYRELADEITATPIVQSCDKVIEAKEVVIVNLKDSLDNCLNSNHSANLVISGLKDQQTSLRKSADLQELVSKELKNQVQLQDRRKWLYLAGGLVVGYAARCR
jgi:hypothetical protein